jgi:DNA (cytosine-5)-methyltransferase 1
MRLTGPGLRDRRQLLGLSQSKLAELTGIRQHLLSAFELQKAELSEELLDAVISALAEEPKVTSLVQRDKRYQERKYAKVPRLPDRISRAKRTAANAQYCNELRALAERANSAGNSNIHALSLFSGCGGFSLGVAAAGIAVKGFVEIDAETRQIYRANFPLARQVGADITKVKDDELEDARKSIGSVDIIIGGPPCQGFSLSGKRWVEDPRNMLFKHYMRFVDAYQPKVAVMENVRLLTSMKSAWGTLIKNEILREFHLHGYEAKLFEVNAKDYGVPQHRERVLFVAVRADLDIRPSIPTPTHGPVTDLFGGMQDYRSFGDACSDLEYLESGQKSHDDPLHIAVRHPQYVIDWLWDVPEGGSAHENADAGKRPPSGYNTTYKRQIWDEPASTVQTTFGMISGCRNVHPIATRSLTIREAARIQSFPDSFKFKGSLGAVRNAIGNAMPPLLAFSLATHVRQRMLKLVEIASL